VTTDPHGARENLRRVFMGIDAKAGGIGGFHVSCGDLVFPPALRETISARYGAGAIWFPVVGNHDAEFPEAMAWLRAEFSAGNGARRPIRDLARRGGPPGAEDTVYSWDYDSAHLVALNVYWDGSTNAGADTAAGGDIAPALLEWLRADLAASAKPFVFVFGHEPAFMPPGTRHSGDSLDAYAENRDAFWSLLAERGAAAYISGHTHRRYSMLVDGVWQVNAGKVSEAGSGEGRTFLDISLSDAGATVTVWADPGGKGRWKAVERIRIPRGPLPVPAR
jgi:hypothetical protein